MSKLPKLIFSVLLILAGMFVSFDGADARRRFSLGSSRSSVRVIPIPRTYSSSSHSGSSTSSAAPTDIQLVQNLPDTSSYSFGSGFFDLGYRTSTKEYVFYNKKYAMVVKPNHRKDLAGALGFDPIVQHEAGLAVPASATQSLVMRAALMSAPAKESSSGGLGALMLILAGVVGLVAIAWYLVRDRSRMVGV